MKLRRPLRAKGFTIVELLIVIVTTGMLAAITIVAYTGIQKRANPAAIRTDFQNAGRKLVPHVLPREVRVASGRGGTTMDDLLLKVPEVASRLHLSRAKVYELIAAGTLVSVKIDGCRRVRSADLLAYVESLSPT